MPDRQWEPQLRAMLANTSAQGPRPISRMEMWDEIEATLDPGWMDALRHAAVLVPVIDRSDGPTILLTLRSDLLRHHSGQVSFPGGRRDADDVDVIDTALREAEEEIGLPRDAVEVIGYLDDYLTTSRYRVTPVVGLIRNLPPLRIDAAEVAEVFEVPLARLLDPASYERKMFEREQLRIPVFEMMHGPHRVWGATAGMLWDLCTKAGAWKTR